MVSIRQVAVSFSLLAVAAATALACDEGTIPSPNDDNAYLTKGPADWNRAVTQPDDATAESTRQSCGYHAGALPGETLGKSTLLDKDLPIQKIIVLMQENRSFDLYFSKFAKYANRTDVEVAPDDASNPEQINTPGSPPHTRQHAPHKCTLDTDHSWHAAHEQYNDGKMDGFYQSNEEPGLPGDIGTGDRALYYYDETDLPFYYELANTFGLGDHYHCSLMGPTWPNRMFLYTAQSFGLVSNDVPDLSAYPYPEKMSSIFDELAQREVPFKIYRESTPGISLVYLTAAITRWGNDVIHDHTDLMADLAAGTLPPVSFIDGDLLGEGPRGDDEHPPGNIELGQKMVGDIVVALTKSPDWKHTAMIVNYDENGGFYDHVVPPAACPPTAQPLQLSGSDAAYPAKLDQYGYRVPILVVSPYAKKSYVSHVVYDHTSVTRFIETKFKLPALTDRDANADPLMDFFDFKNPPFMTPPTFKAQPTVNDAETDYCSATYQKSSGG